MSLSDISVKLNEEVLKEIVTKKYGPETKFAGWSFSGGFKSGDSYLSEVFRVIIDATNPS